MGLLLTVRRDLCLPSGLRALADLNSPTNPYIVTFGPPGAPYVCDIPTTFSDVAFTVTLSAFECRIPISPTPPPQPTCPPPSIKTGDEPQSGDVFPSSGADNSGDYAHQVTPLVQTKDTGNMENSPASCSGAAANRGP